MVTTELERIKVGKLQDQNVKDEYAERLKDNVTAIDYTIDDENEIMMDEIMKALISIKVGKAAGYNRVSSEMLRGGGGIWASLLYQLFNKCWKSHRVPNG
ncbi:hypothetical protein EVAR_64078_1 [Eumeta japonica]|uniref:Uncharacterized protein n=1 Tax=Eumeta variegata TaxID=151549 RepID=A0A4C1ZEG9_EUMVA|nr:hypothetical protein EVAR_64078_1 [Eumeta japonica]